MVRKINRIEAEKGIIQIIERRLPQYYPHLNLSHLYLRKGKCKIHHCSIICEQDLWQKGRIIKTLIVKKRIFNPYYHNDVVLNTTTEFENLKFLNSHSNDRLSVPKVFDCFPDKGILVTEKDSAKSLLSHLVRYNFLPFSEERGDILKQMCEGAGEWLREFHKVTYTDYKSKVDTDEFIWKAKNAMNRCLSYGLSEELYKRLIYKMETLKDAVSNFSFPVSLKHGDYQPINILCKDSRITVLDIDLSKRDITVKDICNFLTNMSLFHLKYPPLFIRGKQLRDLENNFLIGYYQKEEIPYPVIEFLRLLSVLESLQNICKRKDTWMRRLRIIPFYQSRIKALL